MQTFFKTTLCYFLLLFSAGLYTNRGEAKGLEIRYPEFREVDNKNSYYVKLLHLALSKTQKDFKITPVKMEISQSRVISELNSDNPAFDITWVGTSKEMEKLARPIFFPLTKGLLGYRIGLINKLDLEMFTRFNSVKDFKDIALIQGIGWADIDILKANGFTLVDNQYETIFNLINRSKSLYYFPRGVTEVELELNRFKEKYPNLAIEKHLLLVYRFDMLFYVATKNTQLAEIIKKGLDQALGDGSFDKVFYSHPDTKNAVKLARDKKRVKLNLVNPNLSQEMNSLPEKYWFKIH